ncbi:GPR endopeptidase [Clostridium folliculivorans]|uniref:Germination protease n=1 Tax=Clostridium folliculivorans TaxID=2886038 RepID=A0A9W5XZ86_9CLOT|nr:GPR endopeptidase [Clostridium folliculivorans]GKU23614.1 germination protease [Clostridium folliculivorans]GKU29730.1 germination protease [Clostridium folliculivorans]
MINVRTDLAVEARELYKQINKREADGIISEEEEIDNIKVTTVTIVNEDGAAKIGKPIGTYITIDIPEFTHYDGEIMDDVSEVLNNSMQKLIGVNTSKTALVVGLGNWNVTPDALGPKVVEKLMITRHLKAVMPDSIDESVRPVCALAPGVLGITGIETGEIIKAVADKIKPDMVICIDALASRSIRRVNRTIQIANTGISPGAGIGNKRMEINEENLGIPVIAIGVPTVVDAATIVNDAMDLVLDEMVSQSTEGGEFYKMLSNIDKNEKSHLIKSLLNPYVGDLMVTPKEVDVVIDSVSKIISNGLNMALQSNLDMDDINKFMS